MRTKKQHHNFSVCQFELQIQGLQVYKQGFPLCCVKVMRNRESKKNYTKMVIERKNKITEENRFALLDCVRKTKKKQFTTRVGNNATGRVRHSASFKPRKHVILWEKPNKRMSGTQNVISRVNGTIKSGKHIAMCPCPFTIGKIKVKEKPSVQRKLFSYFLFNIKQSSENFPLELHSVVSWFPWI